MKLETWLHSGNRFKGQIIGKLLGDAGIKRQKRRKPRLQCNHLASAHAWSLYCYEQLCHDILLNEPIYHRYKDARLKQGYGETYYVQSRTDDIICYLNKIWYPHGKKIVPFHTLKKYFTAESLAWWYMDDGHLKMKDNTLQKIILSTESFSDDEILQLIHFLNEEFHLPFNIDGQKRIALYDQFHIHYYLTLIEPFIHMSMQRKLKQSSFLLHDKLDAKRTTIYLPTSIQLDKPTAQINEALQQLDQFIELYKQQQLHEHFIPLQNKNIERKGYQIVINKENMNKLSFLKRNGGMSYSELVENSLIKYNYLIF